MAQLQAMEAQAGQGRLSAQTHLATGFAEAQAGQDVDWALSLASWKTLAAMAGQASWTTPARIPKAMAQ
jgi:hypothetical protein